VYAHDFQPVFFRNRLDLRDVFVPNAERRRGAAHVRALRSARAETGVDAHADSSAARDFSESLQLQQRARVVEHARLDYFPEVFRQLLRRKRNVVGFYSRADCALDFVRARRVDVQTE